MTCIPKNKRGFSLVELAMVLFIIGLVLAGVMTPLSTRLEQGERQSTQEMLLEIKNNLIGYALINGHLPCPDCPDAGLNAGCTAINADTTKINDGEEDGVDVPNNPVTRGSYDSCATEVGNLPWVTLGISEYDAWGRHFVYSVDSTFADDIDGTGCGTSGSETAGISFQLCSTGDMTVNAADMTTIAQNIPVLVLSLGANGDVYGGTHPPTSTAELENWWSSTNRIYISNDYINVQGSEFDDLVMWMPPSVLVYQMVRAELLP